MKRTTKKTILLSKEAYLFLQNKMKYERSGKIFRKEFIEKLERNFNNLQYDGYIRLFDYDLGGKENGKWTSWTCEKMATMLDKEKLNYKIGKDAECINL